ncbi:MAG: imelysin family protein, partial [Bacteroidota bacterium]
MSKLNHLFFVFTVLAFAACGDDEQAPVTEDYQSVLANLGNNVILKTYDDLRDAAAALQSATAALEADPTAANLEAARAAWVAARSPWEQSEGFLFGPVDQEGLDPSLDSWPVNVTDLDNVLASG